MPKPDRRSEMHKKCDDYVLHNDVQLGSDYVITTDPPGTLFQSTTRRDDSLNLRGNPQHIRRCVYSPTNFPFFLVYRSRLRSAGAPRVVKKFKKALPGFRQVKLFEGSQLVPEELSPLFGYIRHSFKPMTPTPPRPTRRPSPHASSSSPGPSPRRLLAPGPSRIPTELVSPTRTLKIRPDLPPTRHPESGRTVPRSLRAPSRRSARDLRPRTPSLEMASKVTAR